MCCRGLLVDNPHACPLLVNVDKLLERARVGDEHARELVRSGGLARVRRNRH
jgi:hypothetical protein